MHPFAGNQWLVFCTKVYILRTVCTLYVLVVSHIQCVLLHRFLFSMLLGGCRFQIWNEGDTVCTVLWCLKCSQFVFSALFLRSLHSVRQTLPIVREYVFTNEHGLFADDRRKVLPAIFGFTKKSVNPELSELLENDKYLVGTVCISYCFLFAYLTVTVYYQI